MQIIFYDMEPKRIVEILKVNFPEFRVIYRNGKIFLYKGYFPIIVVKVSGGNVVNIYTTFWLRISVGYFTSFLMNGINITIKEIYYVLDRNNINVQFLYEK